MAVEFMEYRNNNSSSSDFRAKMEENAVQEAASGLESVEKLIRLLSQQSQQQHQYQSSSSSSSKPLLEMEMDYKAVADVAVSKFKKVLTLLGRARTGHARFRRAPLKPREREAFGFCTQQSLLSHLDPADPTSSSPQPQ
ncbi:hypothetical protein F2P56_002887 [Juglans regia]|uniref:Uncharacterized protein n=2 Tax=Juglans regia TaxID=51240 RepID=A0A834D9Z5_JUGRE|nr:probable WRKY transcription factor 15 [Juglans regia]KAF5482305.1 hypothetical protein F2P56_002887 [Juglans regia]